MSELNIIFPMIRTHHPSPQLRALDLPLLTEGSSPTQLLTFALKKQIQFLLHRIGLVQKNYFLAETTKKADLICHSKTLRRNILWSSWVLQLMENEGEVNEFGIILQRLKRKKSEVQGYFLLMVNDFVEALAQGQEQALVGNENILEQLLSLVHLIGNQHTLSSHLDPTSIKNYLISILSLLQSLASCPLPPPLQNLPPSPLKPLKLFLSLLSTPLQSISHQLQICLNINTKQITEEQKLLLYHKAMTVKSKIGMAEDLEKRLGEMGQETETCLSCESKVPTEGMLAHLDLCQARARAEEEMEEIDGEIAAKVYDLNTELIEAKNNMREKLKEFNEEITLGLMEKEKNEKKGKFYKVGQPAKTLDEKIKMYLVSTNTKESFKPPVNEIEDLAISELSVLINVIQEIQAIGSKIKSQRLASNLGLLSEILNAKTAIRKKFNSLSLKSPLITSILNLFSRRRALMRTLNQSSSSKHPHLRFTQDIYFHNEYQDIFTSPSTHHPKRTLSSENYFSQQQTTSISHLSQNQVSLKDFLMIKSIGRGQFGEITLVKKKQTGVKYAMKKIPINAINSNENLQNEFVALSLVNSEFVVKTIFSFTENRCHYFVMEYMPNGDFFQLLYNEKRLYECEARHYLAEIAQGINDLHEREIIHRDIKPHNILISKSGHIKLADFGLSETRVIKKEQYESKKKMMTRFEKEKLNQEHQVDVVRVGEGDVKIVGSMYFMSPEAFLGSNVTKVSDWWSYGILVYQTLLGSPPFVGNGFHEIKNKISSGEIWNSNIRFGYDNDSISLQAKDLIDGLLSVSPQHRLGSNFQDIKSHPFFNGVNWGNLLSQTPYFQFQTEEYTGSEGKEISEETSTVQSSRKSLKVVRKDVLIEETKKCLGEKMRQRELLKNRVAELRMESEEVGELF